MLARLAAGIFVFGLGPSAAAAQLGNGVETIIITSAQIVSVSGIKALELDINGDGVPDVVRAVSVKPGKRLHVPDEDQIYGLWGGQKVRTREARRALSIEFGGKWRHMFLITDVRPNGGYFDTPQWSGSTPPISVAKRGSNAFKKFQKQEKRIRNDVLVLGTEAGIDTALYWNGKTFALFQPNEEP
jgi:hypothetical protein